MCVCKSFLPAYSNAKLINIKRVFPELWWQMYCPIFMKHSVYLRKPVNVCTTSDIIMVNCSNELSTYWRFACLKRDLDTARTFWVTRQHSAYCLGDRQDNDKNVTVIMLSCCVCVLSKIAGYQLSTWILICRGSRTSRPLRQRQRRESTF